jgi:hypothetical protein
MFQPLGVIIRQEYMKGWQLNTLNCHSYERNLLLTTFIYHEYTFYENKADTS